MPKPKARPAKRRSKRRERAAEFADTPGRQPQAASPTEATTTGKKRKNAKQGGKRRTQKPKGDPPTPSPRAPRNGDRPESRNRATRPAKRVRSRRSLSHVGGRIDYESGSAAERNALKEALDVDDDETQTRAHIHGFHSYPARLHPTTARALIAGFSKPGARILDPFCGSGTVLIEALLQGRSAHGTDANPLAVALARFKTQSAHRLDWALMNATAELVAEHADDRRAAKAGPSVRYGRHDRELFDPHMLLELDGLRQGITKLTAGDQRAAFMLVLSSILTKVSRRGGDTSRQIGKRRLASGFAIKMFVRRTEELGRQSAELKRRLKQKAPPVRVAVDDARKLTSCARRRFELIVSSPPYPGVYDYLEHHETRLRWLKMDKRNFASSEIGARRQLKPLSVKQAFAKWDDDFGSCLKRFQQVLAPGGKIALVIADSTVHDAAFRADRVTGELARRCGLELLARGSQARPHFHAESRKAFDGEPRREHVLILGASGGARQQH